VIKGVASPNRNQAIIHGGKEIEMSLIVAAGYAKEPGLYSQSVARRPEKSTTITVDWAFNVDTCSL
jgi:hypothetical protein